MIIIRDAMVENATKNLTIDLRMQNDLITILGSDNEKHVQSINSSCPVGSMERFTTLIELIAGDFPVGFSLNRCRHLLQLLMAK